jgi:hypothetical protein
MVAFALALHLVVAVPPLAPPVDPGPFQGGELAAASLGALAGDAIVLGAGYATLQLFANGSFAPTAGNFRRAAFVFTGAALVLPPLLAVVGGRLGRAGPASGNVWKALLLAAAGHAASLAVGYFATPHYWAIVPAQLALVATGTSVGLHWGPRHGAAPRAAPAPAAPEPPRVDAGALSAALAPFCPDA